MCVCVLVYLDTTGVLMCWIANFLYAVYLWRNELMPIWHGLLLRTKCFLYESLPIHSN